MITRTTNHDSRFTNHGFTPLEMPHPKLNLRPPKGSLFLTGFTLIELIITIVMFTILALVTVYVFRAILLSWSGEEKRAGVKIDIYSGIEKMTRQLLEAQNVDSLNNDEIRFTDIAGTHYIYYLYNASESYPPAFSQGVYELRKAALSGVTGGNLKTGAFTYGSGAIIITDVLPPVTSDLSISGGIVTMDLTVTRGSETVKLRTQVQPRNM